ncbi:MAG: SCO family protein [Anaeromyxobacteraceae bacterium]
MRAPACFNTARAITLAVLIGCAPRAAAQLRDAAPGLREQLGATVPLDLVLHDELGASVRLGDALDKPTLLALVYFRCAGICSPLLNGLTQVVERTGLRPGRDFQVLTVSFDERDTPALAEAKKRNYLAGLSRDFPPDAWRFLTGDAATTKRLADAVGFGFRREGEDFVHPAVVTMLAPGGKITRYLYGISFLPFDVKMAAVEASRGQAVPTASRVLQLCYRYDSAGRRYELDVTRLLGIATLLVLAPFAAVMALRTRRRRGGGAP